MIYHIVIESDFHSHFDGDFYYPPSLTEQGFVHCALQPSVIPVANDFFTKTTEKLLVLEIDSQELYSEVRYEPAEPAAGGGTTHLDSASEFPHVYGRINRSAITGIGVLQKSADGYEWPTELEPFEKSLFSDFGV